MNAYFQSVEVSYMRARLKCNARLIHSRARPNPSRYKGQVESFAGYVPCGLLAQKQTAQPIVRDTFRCLRKRRSERKSVHI
jgi:hypothetical protein